jgi:hypothetical protein
MSLNDQPQLIDTRGWQMTTESTAPSLSIARDDLIQWGVMLGAGTLLHNNHLIECMACLFIESC